MFVDTTVHMTLQNIRMQQLLPSVNTKYYKNARSFHSYLQTVPSVSTNNI